MIKDLYSSSWSETLAKNILKTISTQIRFPKTGSGISKFYHSFTKMNVWVVADPMET